MLAAHAPAALLAKFVELDQLSREIGGGHPDDRGAVDTEVFVAGLGSDPGHGMALRQRRATGTASRSETSLIVSAACGASTFCAMSERLITPATPPPLRTTTMRDFWCSAMRYCALWMSS